MGLFGNLFKKKVCDICGGEIGLFGNRKLEDGNCCKACAAKLSPWFSERKHSTVEEIKQQLEYREANKDAVAAFRVTRSFGRDMKVLVDENACKFMVTRAKDLREANPDVLDFSQATACELDIREDRDEVYREVKDSEGNTREESYSPRRYKFSYDFYMTIRVDHPYFDEMEFSLSNGSIEVRTRGTLQASLFGLRLTADTGSLNESSPTPPTLEEKRGNAEYAECEKTAEEIRKTLMTSCKSYPEETISSGASDAIQRFINADSSSAPAQPVPPVKRTVNCPWCGMTTPAAGYCEHCGGKLED